MLSVEARRRGWRPSATSGYAVPSLLASGTGPSTRGCTRTASWACLRRGGRRSPCRRSNHQQPRRGHALAGRIGEDLQGRPHRSAAGSGARGSRSSQGARVLRVKRRLEGEADRGGEEADGQATGDSALGRRQQGRRPQPEHKVAPGCPSDRTGGGGCDLRPNTGPEGAQKLFVVCSDRLRGPRALLSLLPGERPALCT